MQIPEAQSLAYHTYDFSCDFLFFSFHFTCLSEFCKYSMSDGASTDAPPSEREPLLAKVKSATVSYVEPAASVTNAAVPNGADSHANGNGIVKASQREGEEEGEEGGHDAERQQQPDNDARDAQFKGMPEVRKKMKYILPALSVGVCPIIPQSTK